jgi:hypothetical protein
MLLTIIAVLLVVVYLDHQAQFLGIWNGLKAAYAKIKAMFSKTPPAPPAAAK